jgi:hypothetical protein
LQKLTFVVRGKNWWRFPSTPQRYFPRNSHRLQGLIFTRARDVPDPKTCGRGRNESEMRLFARLWGILESQAMLFPKSMFVIAACVVTLFVPALAQGAGGAGTGGTAQGTGTTTGGVAEQPGTGQGVNAGQTTGQSQSFTGLPSSDPIEIQAHQSITGLPPNNPTEIQAQRNAGPTTGQRQSITGLPSSNPNEVQAQRNAGQTTGQRQSITGLPSSNPNEIQAQRNRGAAVVAPNLKPLGSGSPQQPINSSRR